VDGGGEEGLVHIDVAEPRHKRLVEEDPLQAARPAFQHGVKTPCREGGVERLRPQLPEPARVLPVWGDDKEAPEAPHVLVSELSPRREGEDEVGVGRHGVGRGVERQPSGHPQVPDERRPVVKGKEEVLAAPADRADDPAREGTGEGERIRHDVRVKDPNVRDPLPHHRLERATEGLHLWELRHW